MIAKIPFMQNVRKSNKLFLLKIISIQAKVGDP